MNITVRQMEVFTAIASQGTVTAAAETLFMTQAAASLALAELEKQLGCPLFDRSGRRLHINNNGQSILPEIREILAKIGDINNILTRDHDTGSVKIGASSTVGNYLIPDIIGNFSREYPEVKLSLQVGNTDYIVKELLNYNIDIGFIEGICRHSDIVISKWRHDDLVIFASPEHPLTKKRKISINDLANAEWILREQGSGTREIFENAIRGKIDNIIVRYELGHSQAIKMAVKNNLGISCLSKLVIKDSLDNGVLKTLDTPFLNLRRNLYCLTNRNKYHTRSLTAFRNFCGKTGSEKARPDTC